MLLLFAVPPVVPPPVTGLTLTPITSFGTLTLVDVADGTLTLDPVT